MDHVRQIEEARRREQGRLDLLQGPESRNRNGQFATPNPLAVQIMEYVARLWEGRTGPIRFLEPALGTGSFFSALLQVFPASRLGKSLGVEKDSGHCQVAQALWQDTPLQVAGGDFTRLPPPGPGDRFNLLVTNPPYVRHHHLAPEEKVRLGELVLGRLGIKVSGLAGLYAYFLLLADAWLAEGGLAVWLVPSEFLDVNYGAAVKRYLKEKVKLRRIHRFQPPDVQFEDALVSSAIVVFEKATALPGHRVQFSLGGTLLQPQAEEMVAAKDLAVGQKWTRYPRSLEGTGQQAGSGVLGDLFTIKRGLATGANRFFILERRWALAQGIPGEFLRPILPSPRLLPGAVIEAGSDGYPLTEPQLALIDCRLPEGEVRRRWPGFWSYLERGKAEGIPEGYLASRRSPWYAQEDRPPAPFLCTYMGRSQNGRKPFRFLWNQSAATAPNVYLLLYPRGPLKAALQENPALAGLVFQALGGLDTDTFRDQGRVYGGGLYKMEPKELAQVSSGPIQEALKDHLAGAGMKQNLPFFMDS
jgi:hypothetical protein